jgi:hypothetical protein
MNTLRVVILGAILIASLVACSSAGKCRRGELGCACQTGDTCEPGANCVAERCMKGPMPEGGGGAHGGAGGSAGADSSTAGRDAPDMCSAESFDAACRSYCVAFCESQRAFCGRSDCPQQYCTSASYTSEVQPVCERFCGKDADCARKMCLDQQRTTCETFWFEADGGMMSACIENDPKCELNP